MNETLEFLARHGVAVLFAAVFVEQAGLPLPSAPWLLAAGALIGTNRMNWFAPLIAAAFGSVLADLIWFYLGRYTGNRVLKFLCRISLEPDSCVRRTQNVFTRYGMKGVIVAKFIPGLNTLVPPLAGSSGVTAPRFVFFDGIGSSLYVGSIMLLGVVFCRQLDRVIAAFASVGVNALILVGGIIVVYIVFKYIQRHRLLHELRMARITVDELHEKLESGEKPLIIDVRAREDLEQDPALIQGARHFSMAELEQDPQELPRDRDIVLYCSCPNEVSSARMALKLRRKGITRVHPLLGGIDAWRERNYPTELWVVTISDVLQVNSVGGKT